MVVKVGFWAGAVHTQEWFHFVPILIISKKYWCWSEGFLYVTNVTDLFLNSLPTSRPHILRSPRNTCIMISSRFGFFFISFINLKSLLAVLLNKTKQKIFFLQQRPGKIWAQRFKPRFNNIHLKHIPLYGGNWEYLNFQFVQKTIWLRSAKVCILVLQSGKTRQNKTTRKIRTLRAFSSQLSGVSRGHTSFAWS